MVGTASRYREAAEKASSLEFDVAVLDVNLDGDQTFPIAEALAQQGKCFVFATGYGAASLPDQFSRIPTLQKPFQQPDLERALCVALNVRAVE